MGIFGRGGNSGGQRNASDTLIDNQFRQNQKDIEQKRKALTEERLSIIKSQGNQNWTPKR
jgi:hypothetical protein